LTAAAQEIKIVEGNISLNPLPTLRSREGVRHVTLEDEFQHGMIQVYEVAKDHGYIPSYFKPDAGSIQGRRDCQALMAAREIQYGFG